jgi:hypothetical protein
MTSVRRLVVVTTLALATAALAGCTRTVGGGDPDPDAARTFDGYPLYWLGERFERWDLEHFEVSPGGVAVFIYGTCTIEGWFADGGCAPPLQIQIQPLCAHLDVVAGNQVWRRRQVRGAPVGTIDGAPVLFTKRVQVKVYRGQGSDPGLPMRALQALRSVNGVPPVIDADDPIPAPPRAVLAGAAPCS